MTKRIGLIAVLRDQFTYCDSRFMIPAFFAMVCVLIAGSMYHRDIIRGRLMAAPVAISELEEEWHMEVIEVLRADGEGTIYSVRRVGSRKEYGVRMVGDQTLPDRFVVARPCPDGEPLIIPVK
ncbi:hypothetical protein KW786_01330 [Candidatus Parcubacteria bacterium]|nr:hypothetical protein [Candidatus Parcubacteria bacterium]